jgi:hypothetical protein
MNNAFRMLEILESHAWFYKSYNGFAFFDGQYSAHASREVEYSSFLNKPISSSLFGPNKTWRGFFIPWFSTSFCC